MRVVRNLPAAALLVGLMVAGATARVPAPTPANSYTLSVCALVGPDGTDVTVNLSASAGSSLPATLKKLTLTASSWSRLIPDAPLTAGQWTARYTDLPGGAALTAAVEFKTTKTWNLSANTVVLYRPDLHFASVGAPPAALVGDQMIIPVLVQELRGDLGATFDLSLSGPGVQGSTATAVRVNPLGSTQVSFTVKALSAGPQTVTLTIQNENPGDFNPSDNSTSFVVQVSLFISPTQYYGGYFRSEGVFWSSYLGSDGSVVSGGTDGRSEQIYVVADSTQPMSWPMSASVRMSADGDPVYSIDASNVMWQEDFGDGSFRWVGYGPETLTQLWLISYPEGSTNRIRFYATRSASDYVNTVTQNGITTTSLQQFGTFINATETSELTGLVTSALGSVGGTSGTKTIVQKPVDLEAGLPPNFIRHQMTWDSYSSGTLK